VLHVGGPEVLLAGTGQYGRIDVVHELHLAEAVRPGIGRCRLPGWLVLHVVSLTSGSSPFCSRTLGTLLFTVLILLFLLVVVFIGALLLVLFLFLFLPLGVVLVGVLLRVAALLASLAPRISIPDLRAGTRVLGGGGLRGRRVRSFLPGGGACSIGHIATLRSEIESLLHARVDRMSRIASGSGRDRSHRLAGTWPSVEEVPTVVRVLVVRVLVV